MIDFYENLEYLDYFVKLEEEGKIISFFRDLATDKGITDQWLGLAKKERRNPPPAGYRSPPPLHTPSAPPNRPSPLPNRQKMIFLLACHLYPTDATTQDKVAELKAQDAASKFLFLFGEPEPE